MREGAVGFRHAVRVLALLHSRAAVVRSVEQFRRETFHHCLVVAAARGRDDPADRERLTAVAWSAPAGRPIDAAYTAMQDRAFYDVTLKNFAMPWTNRDQTVFAPLNDYVATVSRAYDELPDGIRNIELDDAGTTPSRMVQDADDELARLEGFQACLLGAD